MRSDLLRSQLDVMLLAVVRDEPAYGYAIIQSLKERTGGTLDLPEGTIYPALHRLERAGLVASRWAAVSGRRRRVYRLTARGQKALLKRAADWRSFSRAMDAVIKGA